MADTEPADNFFTILKNIIFLAAIYLYFMGWVYTYYLFIHFGIPLNSVDIPVYYFFIYSYSVIYDFWFILFFILIFIFAIIFIIYFANIKLVKVVGLSILFLLFFFMAFWLAKRRAGEEAKFIRMGYAKTVEFVFRKNSAESYSKEFLDANKKRLLKLITLTEGKFYVFYQPSGEEGELPVGYVYDISRSDVLSARMWLQNILVEETK